MREEIPAHDDGMRPDAIFAVNRYIINGAQLGVVGAMMWDKTYTHKALHWIARLCAIR